MDRTHTHAHTRTVSRTFYSHWSIVTRKDAILRGSISTDQLFLKGQCLHGCRDWTLTSAEPCWCFSDVGRKCYLVQTLWPLRTFVLHHLSPPPPNIFKENPHWESLQCVQHSELPALFSVMTVSTLRSAKPESARWCQKSHQFKRMMDLNVHRSKPLRRGPIFPRLDLIFRMQWHENPGCRNDKRRAEWNLYG